MSPLNAIPHSLNADTLTECFSTLTSWERRYCKIIQLAQSLPPLPPALKQQQIELAGCENRVWLAGELLGNGTLHYYGDSDSRIVKGLLAILFIDIEGKTPQQILSSDPLARLKQLNVLQQLSSSRSNGITVLIQRIKQIAQRYDVATSPTSF